MDLKFDIEKMEIVIENGDFAITDNPSEQRAGMFLYTKNVNLTYPLAGVGIGGILNSNVSVTKSYLNRWQSQILQDGAKSASWNIQDKDEGIVISTKCNHDNK